MDDRDALRRQLAEKDAEIAGLRRRLDEEAKALRQVMEIATALNSTFDLNQLLQEIMEAAVSLLHAEAVAGALVDEETGTLQFAGALGDPESEVVKLQMLPAPATAEVARQQVHSIAVDDPAGDACSARDVALLRQTRARSLLVVPLTCRERVIGVAEIVNKRDAPAFGERDIAIAEALAGQAAVAIDNARLYARLADAVVAAREPYRP
jgi:GAF domain-containing protein